MHHRLLYSALAGLALCSLVSAQTAVWTAQGNLATNADWNDPANWDTGVVPSGSGAAAVITQATPGVRNPDGPYYNNPFLPVESVAGGALPVITGSLTLGQLRFDVVRADYPRLSAVYIGAPSGGTPADLLLTGAGLGAGSVGGTPIEVNVTSGSSLTFANRSSLSSGETSTLTVYLGESTATSRTRLTFRDDTAIATPSRRITVLGRGPADAMFMDRARAGNVNLTLSAGSTLEFHNTASADAASITLGAGNLMLFDGDTTAATSNISLGSAAGTIVRFAGRSTAAQSRLNANNNQYGAVEFTEQATGGSVSINARRLDISGAVTAGGSTGRQRAGSSTLAPASVMAADARTISVGTISLYDLLLGSNTLEVTGGGWALNIRDSGGAYVSGAGENLVGGGLLINNATNNNTFTVYGPTYNPVDPTHPSYNVLSGLTTVRKGSLTLYSNRLANVTVESAGKFYSSGGTVDGTLLNQGFVSPQTSILKVNGNFAQTSTGTYAPYFAYTPGYPTTFGLEIAGNATLAGTISVSTHPNMFARWAPGTVDLQLLSAASITGRFDTFDTSGNPARIRVTPTYSATTLKVRFEMLPFTALGATPGAQAFGTYLDRVYQYTGSSFTNNYNWIGDSLTFASDPVKVAQAMDSFAPDRYGVLLDHGFATALARRAALDRANNGRNSAVFAEGGRRRLNYEAVNGLPHATSSTDNWLAGGRWVKGAWTVGAYVARDQTDLADDAGTTAKIDSTEPGAFARFDAGHFFAHASVGVSRDRYELVRVVNYPHFGNLSSIRTAAPDGQRTDWSLTAGHSWSIHGWSLTPFAGAVVSRWKLDDFTETTSLTYPADRMAVEGWSRSSRRLRAGIDLAGSGWNGRVQPHLTATWWHESADDRSIPVHLAGESTGYLAPGRPADRNTVQGAIGVDVRLARRAWLSCNAALQHGDTTRSSSDLTAGFRWEF